jgi:hypothetical protein
LFFWNAPAKRFWSRGHQPNAAGIGQRPNCNLGGRDLTA